MRKKYNRGFEFLKNASAVTIVLVSMGLAAYIAIAVGFFGNRENSAAVIMLLVVPPAIMGTVLGINAATNDSKNRLKRLFDAIEEVASGNYGYQISLENAREFTQLFVDFNAMVTELCKTREEIEGFSNAFAHELNTPISSIKGFASLLYETGKETESPQRLEYLRVIADEASRLAGLSGNALLLSKMTAMQIVADKETYNIGEQIRQCVILFDKDIQKKNLKVELAEDFDPLFYGNEDLMRHVWINLFSNAIKFSPENGKIEIAYSVQGNSARISVKDEGPGISEQDIPHIFERYYQVYSNKGGNGLGLAVAKRAAVLNGADIVPETEEGKGCTFSLVYTLPV